MVLTGLPGRPIQGTSPSRPKPSGPGPDADAPGLHPHPAPRARDAPARTDAHARGRDQQIAAGGPGERVAQRLPPVGHEAQLAGHTAGPLDHGADGVGVGRRDLAAGDNLVTAIEVDDFVARGEDPDHRRPVHRHGLVRDRGEHADLGGAERGAGGQHRLAGADVFTLGADVLPRVARVADRDSVARRIGVFLADHAVGAGRDGRTGEEAGRLAGPEYAAGLCAGHDAVDQPQGGAGARVGAAAGVAVHGRVVPRWQIDRAGHRRRAHQVQRVAQ
jgi:hypothetical protein